MANVEAVGRAPESTADPTEPRSWARSLGWGDGVLLATVVLAVLVRAWGLGTQSLWYDEWLTSEGTAGGLGDLVHHVADREGITPPYFLVMWVWARVVGDGDAALRSFSLVAGAATVPVAYALVREVGRGRPAARAAALLVAVNPMLVWYSQEARPYSLLALAGAVSLLAAARADRTGRRADVVLWGVAAAAAVAVHYYALFLVAAEAVALLARRRIPARLLLLAAVPVGVVLAALAPVAVEQYSHAANREWISGFSLRSRVDEAVRTALVGPSPRFGWLWVAVLVLIAGGVVVTAWRGPPADRRAALGVAAVGGLAVVSPLVVAAVGIDVFLGRYLIAALGPLLVAVAVALLAPGLRGPRVASWLGGGVVLVVALAWLAVDADVARAPELQRADWRAVAGAVDAEGRDGGIEGALVVSVGGGQSSPLVRYLPGAAPLAGDQTVVTDRVDVLVARPSDVPCNFFVGRACAFVFLGAPLPEPVAADFRLEERVALGQFVVERYRSDEPVELGRDDLLAPADRGAARCGRGDSAANVGGRPHR